MTDVRRREADPAASRTGVWFVGARGSVASTAMVGALAVRSGLADLTGLVSRLPEVAAAGLPALSGLVFGGHDVATISLPKRVEALAAAGVIPPSPPGSGRRARSDRQVDPAGIARPRQTPAGGRRSRSKRICSPSVRHTGCRGSSSSMCRAPNRQTRGPRTDLEKRARAGAGRGCRATAGQLAVRVCGVPGWLPAGGVHSEPGSADTSGAGTRQGALAALGGLGRRPARRW